MRSPVEEEWTAFDSRGGPSYTPDPMQNGLPYAYGGTALHERRERTFLVFAGIFLGGIGQSGNNLLFGSVFLHKN